MIFIDQIGHKVELNAVPKRIISVVPSQTELLFDLGLDKEVVGITKFCIHPNNWWKTKERVGGTKNLNFENIKKLNPDLIIANKEENTKAEIEALQQLYPVWTSDISNLHECIEMIGKIGEITQTQTNAHKIIQSIESSFGELKKVKKTLYSALYMIWKEPYMSVGSSTFIHHILKLAGFENVVTNNTLYPVLTHEKIKMLNPDLILLSSEPYPFNKNHIDEFKNLCPSAKILLVDGEMFSWYGSRLTKTVQYLIDLYTKIN